MASYINNFLSEVRDDFNNGIRQFTEHPLRYSVSSARELAASYWDATAIVASALAFCDTGNQHLGALREPVILAGLVCGLAGSGASADRLCRNVLTGISALLWANTRNLADAASSCFFTLGATYYALRPIDSLWRWSYKKHE